MDNTAPTAPHDPELDALYEAFLPTLTAARRSYLRTRLAVVLVCPMLLIVGVALVRNDGGAGASHVATEIDEGTETIEEDASEPTPEQLVAEETDGEGDPEREGGATDIAEPDVVSVDLGLAGAALVAVTEGDIELVELALLPGWTAEPVAFGDSTAVALIVTNGDIRFLAKVRPDLGVDLHELPPGQEPEKDEEPEARTRKEIAVGDVGRVVVEREGQTLWLGVLWTHQWFEAVVVTETGPRVSAYFVDDGVRHHVEAWIDGPEIAHGTWVTDPEPEDDGEKDAGGDTHEKEPEKKKQEKQEKEKESQDEEPEVQTRKEIAVGDVGRVVVEREGQTLWLGVLWTHQWFDAVIVDSTGAEVHAYFTNDGFEHHVRAWIKGHKIKHETWVVEPEIEPYDATFSCDLGSVTVLVEGNVARVMSVEAQPGVTIEVLTEVGATVRVRMSSEAEAWLLEAWGNGESVVAEWTELE